MLVVVLPVELLLELLVGLVLVSLALPVQMRAQVQLLELLQARRWDLFLSVAIAVTLYVMVSPNILKVVSARHCPKPYEQRDAT